jgi:glycerol uptake facilitator-like aquaporin
MLSEFVATFGLVAVIWGTVRRRPPAVPFAVGAYITAAVPAFIVAQLAGACTATVLFRRLAPSLPEAAERVVVPHE